MNSGSSGSRTSSFSLRKLAEIDGLLRRTVNSSNRRVVSQFLFDAEKEMRGYDADMDRLKAEIQILESKEKRLKKAMDKYRSLLAPIRLLPQEILTSIFSFVCHPTVITRGAIATPITLSWVCGRWRESLLDSASLWSELEVPFFLWTTNYPRLEQIISVFMDRSRAHPLKLMLRYSSSGATGTETVFRMLFRNHNRWQNVSIMNVPAYLAHLEEEVNSQICFPSLQVLELSRYSEDLPLISLFRNSPVLHTLTLSGDPLLARRHDLPMHQIGTLKFTNSDAVCLNRLRSFTQLEELDLTFIHGPDASLSNMDNLVLSTPTSLAVRSLPGNVRFTLPYLTLPAVTRLHLSIFERPGSWETLDTTYLTDFLIRSACSITSLSLENLPVEVEQTIALIQLMPKLTTLQLNAINEPLFVTSELLRRLIVEPPRSALLPLLTSMGLRLRKENLVEQDLIDIVTSRWIPDPVQAGKVGISCLWSLEVVLRGGIDEDLELGSLRCFRAAGLELQITSVRKATNVG